MTTHTTKTTARPLLTEARVEAALQKIQKGLRWSLRMSTDAMTAGRLREACEDVAGALADLGPELRVVRAARRDGIAPGSRTRGRP
jgi:hypothetical protein